MLMDVNSLPTFCIKPSAGFRAQIIRSFLLDHLKLGFWLFQILLIPSHQVPTLTLFTPRKQLVPISLSITSQTFLTSLFQEVARRLFILLSAPRRKSIVIVLPMGHPTQRRKL